jgi:hypothetical protein
MSRQLPRSDGQRHRDPGAAGVGSAATSSTSSAQPTAPKPSAEHPSLGYCGKNFPGAHATPLGSSFSARTQRLRRQDRRKRSTANTRRDSLPCRNAKLGKDCRHVLLSHALGDHHRLGNASVRCPGSHQLQHVKFSRCQGIQWIQAAVTLQHGRDDCWIQRRTPIRNSAERGDELLDLAYPILQLAR